MPHRSKGFTLLETVIVLVLLGFLTLLIAAAFNVMRHADVRAQQWNQALDETDAAQTYLRRALMHAQPVLQAVPGRPAPTVFTGDPHHMQFVAPAPMVEETTGPKYNDIRIVARNGALWLTLQFSTFAQDDSTRQQPWGTSQQLMGPLTAGAFSYQGIDAKGNLTDWLDQWPWPNRLPLRVRIDLVSGSGITWPTMQIPLLLRDPDTEQQGGGT